MEGFRQSQGFGSRSSQWVGLLACHDFTIYPNGFYFENSVEDNHETGCIKCENSYEGMKV